MVNYCSGFICTNSSDTRKDLIFHKLVFKLFENIILTNVIFH
jgi:hypothetical protein